MTTAAAPLVPFPRVFYVANGIELLERLSFYGVYINLQVYLVNDVGLTAAAVGTLLGIFAIGRAWLPVAVGGVADRMGFRTSLLIAFTAYALAYGTLFSAPTRPLAYTAIALMSVGGAFMKPVIMGCVKKYSPEGRQTTGFAIFYAMVNAGSVVGKIAVSQIRTHISLRASMLTSVVGSVLALLVTALAFFEPVAEVEAGAPAKPAVPLMDTVKAFGQAFAKPRLTVFLLLVSGYYLLIEQFYQTFPLYMERTLGESFPRELITLINPLSIAILQVPVARFTKKLDPLSAMAIGIGIGGVSMVTMGLYPGLVGAASSFFVFAVAEMVFSPRYYDYVASFAPKGQEGMYMGLSLAPFGVGGLVGGILSGRLIEAYLPKGGTLQPLKVWGTYAAIGAVCASTLVAYRWFVARADAKLGEAA